MNISVITGKVNKIVERPDAHPQTTVFVSQSINFYGHADGSRSRRHVYSIWYAPGNRGRFAAFEVSYTEMMEILDGLGEGKVEG